MNPATPGPSAPRSRHSVDLRMRIPWIGRHYYFVIFVGRDRRTKDNPLGEKRGPASPTKNIVFASGLLIFCAIGGLILLAALLYLAKSYAGIDIFRGSSPIPEFLWRIGICHAVHLPP